MQTRFSTVSLLAITILLLAVSCEQQPDEEEEIEITPTVSYHAELTEINPQLTDDTVTGTVDITVVGDSVTFTVAASGLAPNMMHLQHIHGFRDNSDAICADIKQDINDDSIVDLLETELVSGIILIPLHDNPLDLNLIADTFPQAGEDGTISYQKTVSRAALEKAVLDAYGIYDLVFERRVVYVHTISDTVTLPQTVESLQDVPAHLTVPVACGLLTVSEKQ